MVANHQPANKEPGDFALGYALAIQRLWNKACQSNSAWRPSHQAFAAVLHRSCLSRFGQTLPSEKEVLRYLESIHLEDLALACACSEGIETAWEEFFQRFRPVIDAAARAIAGLAQATELTSSLYSELYGIRGRNFAETGRRPLFEYFHGRSKLSTWLRAILAQRHVDLLRESSRIESIDDPDRNASPHLENAITSQDDSPFDLDRARYLAALHSALATALDSLAPLDRLRLSYYYAQDLTLAQIGCLTREHEATVSRKLERARRLLRALLEETLRDHMRLTDAQVALCFQYAAEGNLPFDLGASSLSASSSKSVGEITGREARRNETDSRPQRAMIPNALRSRED